MGIIEKRLLKNGDARYDARIHRRRGTGIKSGSMSRTFTKEADARAWINEVESKIDSGGNISKVAETLKFSTAAEHYIEHARPKSKEAKAKEQANAAREAAEKARRAKEAPAGPEAASPEGSNNAGKSSAPRRDSDGRLMLNPNSKVAEHEQTAIANIDFDMGAFEIASLTNARIQGWIDRFLQTPVPVQERSKLHPYFRGGLDKDGKPKLYAPGTVRRHFFVLKKVLAWTAIRNNFHLDPNLFALLEIPGAWERKRDRRLEDGEEERIRKAFHKGYVKAKEWGHLLDFALATAARMQEILKAEWKDISYKREAWDIPEVNVKTSVFRQVPLSDVAIAALKGMEAFKVEGQPRIFHQWKDSSTLSKAWRRVVVRADIEDLHFHDLRHEAVSRLFEDTDLSDTEIMSITGHTSQEMLKAYAKLRPNALAARLNGKKRAMAAE